MASKLFERLPRLCLPIRYSIEIKPCFESLTFSGKQSVSLQVSSEVSEIVLNARQLNINTASLNGTKINFRVNAESEKVHFQPNEPIKPGQSVLDLEYTGVMNDKMEGFYSSSYEDAEQQKHYIFCTHFEPVGARLAFPCWDEPDIKAVFSIKLVVPQDKVAISNMPLLSKSDSGKELSTYLFEDTPKMSTYLVAFIVGDLEYIEKHDSNNVKVRVYSRKGASSDCGQLSLDTACQSLPFFGEYFQTRYPLPKLDLIAIPDFGAGAMENWGLVTFRELTLLANSKTVSPMHKQSITLTVSHELAHMWFGNLVTMHWWTDLWLKEGFATWIEYLCVNHCFPDMDIWTHFTYGELAVALRLDALTSSHPIEVEVSSPDEINEIFDTISYCKGASLIRMLHAHLGDEIFRTGLCAYLKKHAYSNAVTEDLWLAWSTESGIDVGSVMRKWTQTMGFPVLSVELVNSDQNCLTVILSQKQYKLPRKTTVDEPGQIWPIPLTLTCTTLDGRVVQLFKHILRSDKEEVRIPLQSALPVEQCLVHVNADGTGFYHTRYSEHQLKLHAKNMSQNDWSTPSRFVFINDGFALAKAGFIKISDWLALLPDLLSNESNYAIWRCVLHDGLALYVRRLVQMDSEVGKLYNKFLLRLVNPVIKKHNFLNFDESAQPLSHNESLFRSLLLSTAGGDANDADVVNASKRLFELHRTGKCELPNDLRSTVYAIVVRHSPETVLDYFMNSYASTQSAAERSYILNALGAASVDSPSQTGDVTPLNRVIKFCLNPNGPVRDQDRVSGLCACASWSHTARTITWTAVKNEWTRICDIYQGQFLMSNLIKGVLSGFVSEQEGLEIKQFFETHPVSCPRSVSQVTETLETNHLLWTRDLPMIKHVLTQLTE